MNSKFFYENSSSEIVEQVVLNKAEQILSHKLDLSADFFDEGGTSLGVVELIVALEEESIFVSFNDVYRLRILKDIAHAAHVEKIEEKSIKAKGVPFKSLRPSQKPTKSFVDLVDRYSDCFTNAKIVSKYPLFCDVLELLLPEGNKNSLLVNKYAFSEFYAVIPTGVGVEQLQKALNLLVKNVVSLRTTFNSKLKLILESELEDDIQFDIVNENDINKQGYGYLITKVSSPISYNENSPLSAIFIVRQNDGQLAVLIVAHHIFWDLISGEIITDLLEKCLFYPDSVRKTESLLQYLYHAVNCEASHNLEQYIKDFYIKKEAYVKLIEKEQKREFFAEITLDQSRIALLEASPLKFSMDLLLRIIIRENPKLSEDYSFPLFVNYHNRNDNNRTIVGAVVDYLPIYVSLDSTEGDICDQIDKVSQIKGDTIIRFQDIIKSNIAHCLPLHSLLIRGWEKNVLPACEITAGASMTPVVSDYYRLSIKQEKDKLFVKTNSILDDEQAFEEELVEILKQM